LNLPNLNDDGGQLTSPNVDETPNTAFQVNLIEYRAPIGGGSVVAPPDIVTASGFSDMASVNASFLFGSLANAPYPIDYPLIDSAFLSGALLNIVISAPDQSDDGNEDVAFQSGELLTIILTDSESADGSLDSAFNAGALTDVILSTSQSDGGSLDSAFHSGAAVVTVFVEDHSAADSLDVGFLSGALV